MGVSQHLLIEPDFVNLRMSLVDDLGGDFRAAVVLQRLYWRQEHTPEGYRVAMVDLATEVHMPLRTLEAAVSRLRERGYLETFRADRFDPTLTFRVILDRQTSGHVPADSAVTETADSVVTSYKTIETRETVNVGKPTMTPGVEHSERLCILLADLIEGNGSKRPTVTRKWLDACRLLIDRDGRMPQDVEGAIRWSQRDEFWRSNILSMPTLREKFDRLRLEAERRAVHSGKNPAAAVAAGQGLVARLEAQQSRMIDA